MTDYSYEIGIFCIFVLMLAAPAAATEFTGWNGTVTLDPETNVTVDGHEAWGDSALAALDAASKQGSFTYNVSYTTWGHYLNYIDGLNEGSWIFLVNGEEANLGIGNYRCQDGDLITLYNGTWIDTGEKDEYGWNVSVPSPLNESDAIVNITAQVPESIFTGWNGTVTLDPETNITVDGHEAWGDSALAALDAASKQGSFTYNVSYTTWGHYLNYIGDLNEGSWIFLVNGEEANLGIGNYRCQDGDLITLYNGTWIDTGEKDEYGWNISVPSPLNESDAIVNITAQVPYIPGPQPTGEYPMFHSRASRDGYVSGEGPATADNLREVSLNGPAYASPVIDNGRVYISACQGDVYCINTTTMAVEWQTSLPDKGGYSTAAVSDGRLYVGSYGGSLYALDCDGGDILWNKKLETDGQWWGLASSPLIYDGQTYVTSKSDGTLHAFNSEGAEVWNFTTGHAIEDTVGYYSSPAADNGRVFFPGSNGTTHALFCVDVATRTEVWEYATDGPIKSMTAAISNGTAYITTGTTLSAINTSDGARRWSVPFAGNSLCTPAVEGDSLYAGSSSTLYCLSTADGSTEWSFPANGTITSSPVLTDTTVYFATNVAEGTVYAVDTATGTERWHYTLNPPEGKYYNIMSSPAVAGGKLYIGGDDGKLHIFASGGDSPFTGWNGTVTLTDTTFTFVPSNNASASYELDRTTDLGALDAAATEGGFTFNASDADYKSYGSFFLEDIDGIANEDWTQPNAKSWSIVINGVPTTAGLGANDLSDGDEVIFYYCPTDPDTWAPITEEATYVVDINVTMAEAAVGTPTLTNGARGGFITAETNVSAETSGWYVITVSGTDKDGDAIAGTGTVLLDAGETVSIPVIVTIPAQTATGTYTLYAGIYHLDNYASDPISHSGGSTCVVS